MWQNPFPLPVRWLLSIRIGIAPRTCCRVLGVIRLQHHHYSYIERAVFSSTARLTDTRPCCWCWSVFLAIFSTDYSRSSTPPLLDDSSLKRRISSIQSRFSAIGAGLGADQVPPVRPIVTQSQRRRMSLREFGRRLTSQVAATSILQPQHSLSCIPSRHFKSVEESASTCNVHIMPPSDDSSKHSRNFSYVLCTV